MIALQIIVFWYIQPLYILMFFILSTELSGSWDMIKKSTFECVTTETILASSKIKQDRCYLWYLSLKASNVGIQMQIAKANCKLERCINSKKLLFKV